MKNSNPFAMALRQPPCAPTMHGTNASSPHHVPDPSGATRTPTFHIAIADFADWDTARSV